MMQAHLLVGPIPINGYRSFSSAFAGDLLSCDGGSPCHRSRWKTTVTAAAASSSSSSWSSPSPASIGGGQNHYAVLGIPRSASFADIKRAYRLLALKLHPDVSKDSRAEELFKSIRHAYEVLSNEATRIQYDRTLKHQENSRSYRVKRHYSPEDEDEDAVNYYSWSEKKRRSRYERFYGYYSTYPNSHFYCDETDDKPQEKDTAARERGSFLEVLKSAFLSIFLLNALGSQVSLTFSTVMALLDKELDTGYKLGYLIAWVLGGRGGVLLTLCLGFASWVCGKASSSVVVLVVVAMWVGSNLARHAPLPQGALLTLLYMSIKLQSDSR
ncbi:PREDICTED: dnaJ homolog subfamily C member 18 [Tarenaya hassleriana]|uniref:dnaJ homolog subfamily C member 18 n=1 Tax=Tarenaya hassleriana TaxID=28532 RepID=UPI00053C1DBA|nr:PREDICTED: dnaJ homolog subfamily C member 18 [Tarenaya hassleriana]